MPETWIQSLRWEDPLEKGKATHSSILAWRTLWTEEPGCSLWGHKEWFTIEQLTRSLSLQYLQMTVNKTEFEGEALMEINIPEQLTSEMGDERLDIEINKYRMKERVLGDTPSGNW